MTIDSQKESDRGTRNFIRLSPWSAFSRERKEKGPLSTAKATRGEAKVFPEKSAAQEEKSSSCVYVGHCLRNK